VWPTVGHQIFAGGPPVDTGFFEARPENHFWPLLVLPEQSSATCTWRVGGAAADAPR